MFLDNARLPGAELLERHFEQIDRLFEQIAPDEFVEWVLGDAYVGHWRLFGVHHRDPNWVFADRFNRNGRDPRVCEIAAMLARVPGLVASTFMQLDPGSHIHPHVDDPALHSARLFIGVRSNAGAKMRAGDEVRAIERGRVYAFDSAVMHETINEGTTPRIIFGFEVDWDQREAPLLPSSRLASGCAGA